MFHAAAATERTSYLVSYSLFCTFRKRTSRRCSMGFKSGLCADQSRTTTPERSRKAPSALDGKGHCLAGSQTPAPDHDKAVLLMGACGF